MRFKPFLSIFVLALLGAGWVAGSGASADYAPTGRSASAQAAVQAQPELDTWTARPSLGTRSDTQVSLSVPAGSAEAGKVTLYVPAGYAVDLFARPGTVEGHVLMVTASDFAVGDLKAVNPAQYVNTPQAQACAPGQHVAVWIMDFQDGLFSSQTVTVPVYIDPTSGDEAALGAYKLQACLPLAHLASPGGWPLGAKLRGVAWQFTRITNPTAAAVYVWRGFVSGPDVNGNPDPATAYELRSDMSLPAKLSLSARLVGKHHRVVLSGQLTTPSAPVGGLTVGLYRLGFLSWTRVSSVQTQADGSYRFVRSVTKTTTFGVAAWAVGACNGGSTAPNGCVDETRAEVDSRNVRIVVRHRRA
jgi:hypothetical protein